MMSTSAAISANGFISRRFNRRNRATDSALVASQVR
jgi:hypothetical protein